MTGTPRPALVHEALRYTAVAILGLMIDLAVGVAAHRLLGVPLVFSSALGFLTGVATNYVLFEKWVFSTGKLAWSRLGKAYAVAQGALLLRLGSVWLLGRIITDLPHADVLILTASAGLSFTLNFVLTRLVLRR